MYRALISAAAGAAVIVGGSAQAWASPVGTDVLPGRAAYAVQPGDSFWSVGQRYDVTMADLAGWNHLDLDAPLDSGWTLQIPPVGWHAPTTTAAVGGYSVQPTVRHSSWASARPTTTTEYTGSGIWGCIAAHESGGNPGADTGNGYYGLYQFTLSTWQAAGGAGNPAAASAGEQTAVAERVLARQGWSAWPVTSRLCGA